MNYFNYQPQCPMGQVWSLFTDLRNAGERQLVSDYDEYGHSLDIIKAAISGNISEVDFNLSAYETQCYLNDKKDFYNKLDKVLYIVDNATSDSEDLRVNYGEISSNSSKLKSQKDPYVDIEDMSTFESNLNELLGLRNSIIAVKGVDIVELLKNSLKGIPDAIKELSIIVKEDTSNLSCILSSLLESEVPLSRLEV